MGRHTLEGNPPISVDLRRSVRAKRLSLRVSRLDGRVTLSMPQHVPVREAIRFLSSRENWLRGHLNDVQPRLPVRPGSQILYRGKMLPVLEGVGRTVRILEDRIELPVGPTASAGLRARLKAAARDALAIESDTYARQLGRSYSRITLRDTRSRWGSCSSTGALMYSWRLIMAPPAVLQYVAAHEVAHLVEMNHSAAFWDVVARLMPDYQPHRSWLRTHGHELHRYVFDD